MAFDLLLGNDRLKENLHRSLQNGHISHFYLISGPEGAGKRTLARLLSAAILCKDADRPCRRCSACRKVLEGVHPDVITVDDPEKKNVPVELIRQARSDIYVQPNEADHKIYLLPRAQDMLPPAQNALLKVLEEPPKYGVFVLLTDNPEKLLPTIRSRCVELKLTALPESILRSALMEEFPKVTPETIDAAIARSGGFLGQAKQLLSNGTALPPQTEQFAAAYAARDALALTQTLVAMEKTKRDQLIPLLEQWIQLLEGALADRAGAKAIHPLSSKMGAARSGSELMTAIGHLKKCVEYAQGNISPAAICGYLVWALR